MCWQCAQHDRGRVQTCERMYVPLTNNPLVRELHTLRFLVVRRLRRMCTVCLGGIFVADQPSNALKEHRSNHFRVFKNLVLSRELATTGIRIREELSC
jgi:hypothetical protein